jgi:hypothetical protein
MSRRLHAHRMCDGTAALLTPGDNNTFDGTMLDLVGMQTLYPDSKSMLPGSTAPPTATAGTPAGASPQDVEHCMRLKLA